MIKKPSPLNAMILICVTLVLTTLVGGSWFVLERTWQTALKGADVTLQNAALVVESMVNRQLLQVDGALVSLPSLLATIATDGRTPNYQDVGRLLRGLNFQTFAFRDIILIRADGGLWASARRNPWNGHFPMAAIEEKSANDSGPARVLGPLRNPVTGDWVLLVTRRVDIPGAGVLDAVAEVPLPFVSVLFAAVGEIRGLRVSIERRNGQLFVSQPYDEGEVGKFQPAGVARAQLNQTLGIEVRRATLYPDVIIALTLDLESSTADWARDRNRLIIVVALTILLLSALFITLNAARRHRELADTERSKFRAILDSSIESMSDGFVMWDAEDRLVTCNEQFRKMYQVSSALIQPGAKFDDVIRHGAELGQYPEVIRSCATRGGIEAFVRETAEWRRDNTGPMECELANGRWALITERKTSQGGTVGIRTDITDLKRAVTDIAAANKRAHLAMEEAELNNQALRERDRALHIQNVLFDAALNNMSQGLIMTDGNENLIVINQRFLALCAIDPDTVLLGLPAYDLFAAIGAAGALPTEMVEDIYLRQRNLADARQSGAFVVSRGSEQSIAVSQRPISDGGWVATYEDVSEQLRAEENIRFAAHHDALTKLPNRVLFRIRLDEMIGTVAHEDSQLAVLYLDLDRFKQVNDTLGHPVGDALLEAAARRLIGCLRSGEIAARLGGDEFAIAYESTDLPDAAEQLGRRIIDVLSAPYQLAGHTVIVGASIGIALSCSGDMDADTLLKNADMALYRAKATGRGVCSVFEADMERQLLSRLAIEEDLRGALGRGEFELLYQPMWDLKRNRITGFEALIRWNHPVRGRVPPIQFIQIAEETGMIRSIGTWVVNRACADAMTFPDDVKVAVNLSGSQFDDAEIIDIVTSALESSRLPARRLELEITETTLLKNNETTLELLFRLRKIGLRIALDDFGTGYSSLSHLRMFPFDKIKIDRSFVREMATRADCAAIVDSIVGLANALGITTTAEGIETIEQLALIRATGCTEVQGYLFSGPRSLLEVYDYFASSTSPLGEAADQSMVVAD